jgi:hypothetical protein
MPQVQFDFEGKKYKADVTEDFFNIPQDQQQQMLFDYIGSKNLNTTDVLKQEDETTSRWDAIKYAAKMGFLDTYRGVKQLLGLEEEEEAANQAKLNEYMNDPKFGNWATAAYFGGAVLDPAGWLIPATKAKTVGKMALYGLGTGGLAGATGYVDEQAQSLIGEGQMTRGEQALLGAAGGSVVTPFMGKMIEKSKKVWEPAGEKMWKAISSNPEPGTSVAGGMVGYNWDQDATAEEKMKNALIGATLGGSTGFLGRVSNDITDGGVARFLFPNSGLTDAYMKEKGLSKKQFNQIQREFLGLINKFQGEDDDTRRLLHEMLTGNAYDFKEFANSKGVTVEVRDFSGDFVGLNKTNKMLRDKYEAGGSAFIHNKVDPETGEIVDKTLYFDPLTTKKKYEEKAWQNPRLEGVEPLSDDLFPTYWDYERFVKTHEIQHIKNPRFDGESRVDYENRINRLAVEEMNNNPFELRLKQDVDKAREVINKYGKALTDLGVLNKETFMENYDTYLHRMYKNPEFEKQKHGILRARKQDEIRTIGQELKARGRIEEIPRSDWEVNKDQYLDPKNGYEILSMEHYSGSPIVIGGRTASKFVDPEFKINLRNTDRYEFDTIVVRRDYTAAERAQMGEVTDAAIALQRTSQLLSNDISSLTFYKTIANSPYAFDPEKLSKITQGKDYAKGEPGEIIEGYMPGPKSGFKQIPKHKRFGELSGKFVSNDVYFDIITMDDWKSGSFLNLTSPAAKKAFDSWKALNGWWKLTKTAYNIPVHMNNFGSNIVMYDLNDGSMKGLRDAFNQLLFPSVRGASDRLKMAQDFDVFGGNFIGGDVLKKNADLYRAYGVSAGATGIDRLDKLVLSMPKTLLKIAKQSKRFTTDKMQELYTWEDNLFRLGLFNTLIDKGVDPATAAIKAKQGFVDYAATSPMLEALRHTALPFVAYAYGIAPRLAEAAVKRPWKFAKWAAVVGGLNAIGEDLTNDPEKVKRERVARQNTLFDLPFMPYTDIKMAPEMSMTPPKGVDASTYFGTGRMVPGQMFTPESTGGFKITGLPSSVQPSFGAAGGLLFPAMGIPSMGTDPIPPEDRPAEMFKQFVPNLPIPGVGTYAGNKLKRGFTEGGFVSDFKDTQTRVSSMLQTFGIRLQFVEADKELNREYLRIKKLFEEKRKKARKIEQDFYEKQLTQQEYDKKLSEIELEMMELEKLAERKGI